MELMITLGYALLYQGKVGELYEVPDKPDQLLMVRSDRLSIFDFVLNCRVMRKGIVLIALTHYWLTQVFGDTPNHLLAWGWNPELWQAAGWDMADVVKLHLERTVLIRRCDVWKYEMIYRGHLGGSVWKQYQKDGTVAGIRLPDGLKKWERVPDKFFPLFTPTTKAESGHDQAMTIAEYHEQTGDAGMMLALAGQERYRVAYDYLLKRDLLLLDTKEENSPDGDVLDELFTPDSSRYAPVDDLPIAIVEGRDPIFFDKEPVRVWGRHVKTPWGVDLQELDNENPEHLSFVDNLEIPDEVIKATESRYVQLVELVTGDPLEKYLSVRMRVPCD